MTPKWTLPATDGARVATDRLLKNTVRCGAQVDCLFVLPKGESGNPEELKKAWAIENVSTVERHYPASKWKRGFGFARSFIGAPDVPITFASFAAPKVVNKVAEQIKQGQYDILLLDVLHLAACFYKGGRFHWPPTVKRVVLRAHNFEQELWYRAAVEERLGPKKWLLKMQADLVKRFENKCFKNVHAIAAISAEDLAAIRDISPETESVLTPLGLDFNHPLPTDTIKRGRLLFVGRLDWPPNRDGLEWFLDNVWDEVIARNPEYELQIVGSGNSEWLKAYRHKKNLLIQGFIDDIDDAYGPAEFTLIPMRYGSGTRIKVIETYAKGRPIMTTKMGIQGADLDESAVLLAETKEEWVALLSDLRSHKTIHADFESNRRRLAENFDEVEVGRKFYKWLQTLV